MLEPFEKYALGIMSQIEKQFKSEFPEVTLESYGVVDVLRLDSPDKWTFPCRMTLPCGQWYCKELQIRDDVTLEELAQYAQGKVLRLKQRLREGLARDGKDIESVFQDGHLDELTQEDDNVKRSTP